jgi:hypothetical protein
MTCLSFGVPAAIGRWKQGNARRLRSVLWIFVTYVPGAAWKRSAPLQTKRTEAHCLSVVRRRVLCALKSNNNGEALTKSSGSGVWLSLAIRGRKGRLILSAANTEGPRERARHRRGLALRSQAPRGLRLGATTAPEAVIALHHRKRDHVIGIAIQIPTTHARSPCRYRQDTRGSLRSGNVSVQPTLTHSHGERRWMRSELPDCLD